MALPDAPAGFPAVGVCDQRQQALIRKQVPLVDLRCDLLAGSLLREQPFSVLLKPLPVNRDCELEHDECIEPGAAVPAGDVSLRGPAGSGKTFVAMHVMLRVLAKEGTANVLFVVQNTALAYFVAKWVMVRVSVKRKADIESVLNRFHVLHGEGMARASFEIIDGLLALKKIDASTVINYSLVVVDKAHHLCHNVAIEKIEKFTVGSSGGAKKLFVPRLLLSNVSQSSSTSTHGTNLFNGLFRCD
jgi:hypothetical protein